MANRVDRWRKFRRFISSRAKNDFTYLLSERAFRGTLVIAHGDKELDIQVEPDITRRSDKGRQTKTLSGGEKSFSTICLLLSLWEAMGSPIRCLDELYPPLGYLVCDRLTKWIAMCLWTTSTATLA